MASSLNNKIIFLLLVNGYLSVAIQAEPTLLQNVCNKTTDRDFCLYVFGSDPATRAASLPGLAQIALDKATDKATKTRTKSRTRAFSSSDPVLRAVLTHCVHHYDRVLAALRKAPFDLSKGHYADLNRHVSDAVAQAYACELEFNNRYLNSPLFMDNLQLKGYCNIVEVIANISN